MEDFPYLLVRAARVMGNTLAVATLLDTQPAQVYRWIAGVDLPDAKRIAELNTRLQQVL